jgi:predicted nucleic-acid-binding Zn-ribbon protein
MNDKIECIKCRTMAVVLKHVSNADELARAGLALGLGEPARPFYLIECPNCGKRVVEEDILAVKSH